MCVGGGAGKAIWFKFSMPEIISVLRVLLVILLSGCWATLGIFFSFVCSQRLFQPLAYLKWQPSQSSRRNSHRVPWPKLSSRWVASPLGRLWEEALPRLLSSPTQGRRQLNPRGPAAQEPGRPGALTKPLPHPLLRAPCYRPQAEDCRPLSLCQGS